MKDDWIRVADILRTTARYPLLILGILTFLFALASGSEGYGGGIMGIIKNSPNAIPWLILLLFIMIAWKWELIGGIMITVLGIALFTFFNFRSSNFFLFAYVLTIIITILGSFFILSWLLRTNAEQTSEQNFLKNPRNLLIIYSFIVVICLTVAGLYAQNRYQKFNTPPDRTSIIQPLDGEHVDRQISMMGGYTSADSLKDLWLFVQPADSTRYYPQQGPLFKPPMCRWWYATAFFGDPNELPGKQYHVYLFVATEEASKKIKDYLTTSNELGQWAGLTVLPDGLAPLDTVTVIRKE